MLYFSSKFTVDAKGKHQITRISEFCVASGKKGILAVELRSGEKGSKGEIRLVPWRVVRKLHADGEKGIPYATIRDWPQLLRVKGVLNLDQCLDELRYSLAE